MYFVAVNKDMGPFYLNDYTTSYNHLMNAKIECIKRHLNKSGDYGVSHKHTDFLVFELENTKQ